MDKYKFTTKEYKVTGKAEVTFETYINADDELDAEKSFEENLGFDFEQVKIIEIKAEESKYE